MAEFKKINGGIRSYEILLVYELWIKGVLMDRIELDILELFNRYLMWVNDNNLKDNIYNYTFYVNYVEKN